MKIPEIDVEILGDFERLPDVVTTGVHWKTEETVVQGPKLKKTPSEPNAVYSIWMYKSRKLPEGYSVPKPKNFCTHPY